MTKTAKPFKDYNGKLNSSTLGFSIDPNSKRTWVEIQYSERLREGVVRRVRVFSIDEAMSSSENLEDSYNPRGSRIGFLICGDTG